jgi:predicted cupin superfamily sugar epimerase
MDIPEIVARLGLQPHPTEGGYFAETYRSADILAADAIDPSYNGPRSVATAIYYLITPDSFSAMHRVASDEVFHFYLGDPVEQLHLRPDGGGGVFTLGPDLMAGQHLQLLVPRGTWQGARLMPGGRFALLGATVAPGFEFADYDHGDRSALSAAFPDFAAKIEALTLD